MHADQTHGINDLRVFYIKRKKTVQAYADKPTIKYLKSAFSYCFKSYNKEYPATIKLNKIKKDFYLKMAINLSRLILFRFRMEKLIVFVIS